MQTTSLGSLLKLALFWRQVGLSLSRPPATLFVQRNSETEPRPATKKQNHAIVWGEASAANFGRFVGRLATVVQTCNPSKQEAKEAG